MYICFAEYRIAPESRELYLETAERLQRQTAADVKLYEGTDQIGLFVEVWTESTVALVEKRKEERLSERSSWSELTQCIAGGSAKLHVWTFKPIGR